MCLIAGLHMQHWMTLANGYNHFLIIHKEMLKQQFRNTETGEVLDPLVAEIAEDVEIENQDENISVVNFDVSKSIKSDSSDNRIQAKQKKKRPKFLLWCNWSKELHY